ncbi:MAG TPA: branched-chain amino acid ABC transporter substrate-binding protein [Erysipelotrichaceae bacterium]|nr:branched-chain amino acid ABC transporter substrate-binding protein [Erysipelotrichaceae bacterium]HBZ40522.1 branched-chain amino acid ABC transporter substrate-binding protein [Erysipelotrichaceae bacterium]
MKRILVLVATALLVLSGFTACTSTDKGTIKIGVNVELTGEAAVYGQPEKKAIELAVKEINDAGGILGKQVEAIYYDTKTDGAESTSNVTKLATEDKVVAIIGAAISGTTMAAAPVANQYMVPMLTPSGSNAKVTNDGTTVYPYVYRACFIDPFQGVVIANFSSTELGATKAAVIGSSSSDYAKDLATIFADQFEKNGGTVVAEEYYTDTDTDFNAILTKLQNAGEFDVLFIADYAVRAGLIIGQARTAGIMVPIVGPDGFESPDLVALAGGADKVNDIYFSTHFSTLSEDQAVKDFIAAYTASAGEAPSALSALAYDAVYMLKQAIEDADSTDPVKVNTALEALKDFKGITGTINFDEWHNPIKSAIVVELVNGEQASATVVNP